MAIPPEPLQELLPQAQLIVDAVVAQVLNTGPEPDNPPARHGYTSLGLKTPAQDLVLNITKVLKGSFSDVSLIVHKPEGAYVLQPGHKGAFMLAYVDSKHQIVGRYGPDTYRVESIERALKEGVGAE